MTDKPTALNRMQAIVKHAQPLLVSQLASISTVIIDTAIAGRVSTVDLAAVGIGNGLYISVMLAGAGIVQGLTPIAAHHYGAKHFECLRPCFQQTIWLCLGLAMLAIGILAMPGWMLDLNKVSGDIALRTRDYLQVISWSLPGTLVYRTCGGMLNALGRPRLLMHLGLCNATSHLLLAPALAFGWLGTHPLGAVGCALSMLINTTLLAVIAMTYLARSESSRYLNLFANWERPQRHRLMELLKLGLPIGVSTFVEMTSFALISLLVASLGALDVAANRVVSNYIGLCYMLPLSISIATLALVGQASGAADHAKVRDTIKAGLALGCGASLIMGCALIALARPLTIAYTPSPEVQQLVLRLIPLVAFNQFFDSLQTISAQSLRGLKIARGPMVIHLFCFWGIGLLGGWWLCYRGIPLAGILPQGISGFWQAGLMATLLASLLFGEMLRRTLCAIHQSSHTP